MDLLILCISNLYLIVHSSDRAGDSSERAGDFSESAGDIGKD